MSCIPYTSFNCFRCTKSHRVTPKPEDVGSTSSIRRLDNGLLLKSLHRVIADKEAYHLLGERGVLERLGDHPNVVRYVVALRNTRTVADPDV